MTEDELNLNQHFSIPPTDDQMKILKAKKLLESCKYFVNRSCIEKDYSAFSLMADIEKFLSDA